MKFSRTIPAWVPAFGALTLIALAPARAIVLDWDAVSWTPGVLSQSFDIDPSHPGDDITITISGDTGRLRNDPLTGNATPDLSTWEEGGLSPAEYSLALAVDYANRSQAITVTVDFLYDDGVMVNPISIFNVDRGTRSGGSYRYVDQIREISGRRMDDSLVAASLTGSVSNQVIGSGLSAVVQGIGPVPDSGAASGRGNVTLDFGSEILKQFQFTFGSDSSSRSNPDPQGISLYDVEFVVVPEAGATATAAMACLLAIVFWRSRAIRLRAASSSS